MFGEKLNQEEAYILGFVLADGGITYANRAFKMRIALNERDLEILEKIKDYLGKGSICFSTDKSGYKEQRRAIYQVYGEPVHGLMSWGIEMCKTGREEMLGMNKDVYRHFIRGFFDGDGHITYGYNPKTGRNVHQMGFVGTNELLSSLESHFRKALDCTPKKIDKNGKSEVSFSLKYCGGKELVKIYNYFYEGATIYLERKHDKFKIVHDALVKGKEGGKYHGKIF